MAKRPNCNKCIYHYITHDPVQPHGCRGLGFKSAQIPSVLVFATSGIECQTFTEKKSKTTNIPNTSNGSGNDIVA
jgi:hypothetical protein